VILSGFASLLFHALMNVGFTHSHIQALINALAWGRRGTTLVTAALSLAAFEREVDLKPE
jgi:hypothetical protein